MYFPLIKHTTPKRLRQLERNVGSMKYRVWRAKVLERDDNTCQWSGCTQKEGLEIHHIKRWANNLHLRYNVFNGITLCKEHHQSIFNREATYEVVFLKTVIRNDELLQQRKGKSGTDVQDTKGLKGESSVDIPKPPGGDIQGSPASG